MDIVRSGLTEDAFRKAFNEGLGMTMAEAESWIATPGDRTTD